MIELRSEPNDELRLIPVAEEYLDQIMEYRDER